jgi:hypothetical protein
VLDNVALFHGIIFNSLQQYKILKRLRGTTCLHIDQIVQLFVVVPRAARSLVRRRPNHRDGRHAPRTTTGIGTGSVRIPLCTTTTAAVAATI